VRIHCKRVEFVITRACTGRCKHCSLGEPEDPCAHVNYAKLAGFLSQIKANHPLESVMCFGGEPLLYPTEVFAILDEARRLEIPRRQIITNGFFSPRAEDINEVARQCNEYATEVLLSVDAFHQETIPLEPVIAFAEQLAHVRLHPAWLVGREDGNPYNQQTREILSHFGNLPTSSGNVIFPAGNALLHFWEYFTDAAPPNPYHESPDHVTCLSIKPNGDVCAAGQVIGSAYDASSNILRS